MGLTAKGTGACLTPEAPGEPRAPGRGGEKNAADGPVGPINGVRNLGPWLTSPTAAIATVTPPLMAV
ncbi:hypothetical protein CMI37_14875 [Candidatus Pacearchaeota archaeon]|nr:hypothetical protein [Candidatus Pacearchaeota archaeon]